MYFICEVGTYLKATSYCFLSFFTLEKKTYVSSLEIIQELPLLMQLNVDYSCFLQQYPHRQNFSFLLLQSITSAEV